MPLLINTSHSKHNTIKELYTYNLNQCTEEFCKRQYRNLISVIKLIDSLFPQTEIWCLTSIGRLVLMNKNDWETPWYVIISNAGTNEYWLEYLVPKEKSPWNEAYIRGSVETLEKVKAYLLIAMKESDGWPESEELNLQYNNSHPHP